MFRYDGTKGGAVSTSPRTHYQQGDHVCTLYSTREEQLEAAIHYLRAGLSRGERCLYVCSEYTPEECREGLKKAGIDVEVAEARGALLILTKNDAHLESGSFDPDKMITLLHAAVKDARDAGFKGLCAAGDMSWLLDGAPGSERIAEYEEKLNAFYPSQQALGLCLYNRSKLPPEVLDCCLATHPHVRVDENVLLENPFYEGAEYAERRTADRPALSSKIEWFRGALEKLRDGQSPGTRQSANP